MPDVPTTVSEQWEAVNILDSASVDYSSRMVQKDIIINLFSSQM